MNISHYKMEPALQMAYFLQNKIIPFNPVYTFILILSLFLSFHFLLTSTLKSSSYLSFCTVGCSA